MVLVGENWRPRRSALYVPAANARALEKAAGLPADCLIFDLEDSVAPGERGEARSRLAGMFASGGTWAQERIVRISARPSEAFADDLACATACRPDAVLLPKAEDPAVFAALRRSLGEGPALWAMVETPRGLLNIGELAAAGKESGLAALVVGPNDLAKSTGVAIRPGRAALVPWLMSVIAAARAHGMAALDGVYNRFRDIEGLAAECRQGAEFGFDGKTLIHPGQIETCNREFGPSEAEIARARQIVEAFDLPANQDKGVIQLDGEMIERLHLEMAKKLLNAFNHPNYSGNETD